ncbi:MAG: hypothetical protein F6K40_17405 [Okeania sp. SIO3I5]|uniref:element excision factor XisH family protein n=1 Tax=Okeania sp. SIO3I5 TaxID=2607805 RepID=UPI0013BD8A94|nr:element excision factor XisH family protein [Okeania sp. SIO3I5]NEQ37943.1 hypothetical protein [Okeania sp. SIO3I5]
MPARDAYHANLINALVKDNWSITDDSYVLKWGPFQLSVISYQYLWHSASGLKY